MGVCYSKAGELESSNGTTPESSELSTSNSKALSYESPRWSAETGDKGKLGALFYRRRRFVGTPDLFSAHIESLLGGIQNFQRRHSPGEITLASFLGTPFVRSVEVQGIDALTKSYTASAAKEAARDTFLFLQERDKSDAVEVLPPMIKIQTPDNRSSVDENVIKTIPDQEEQLEEEEEEEEDFEGEVPLESSPDEEIDVLEEQQGEDSYESSEETDVDEEDIDLGAPYKAGMQRVEQRSFFESCFPATGRWASVVNAARQSACLSRLHSSERTSSRAGTEASEPSSGLSEWSESEIRHESSREMLERMQLPERLQTLQTSEDGRFSASDTCSEGHACVSCCRSREDKSAAATAASSRNRSVKSETGSSSDQHLPGGTQRHDIERVVEAQRESAAGWNSPSSEDVEDPRGSGLSTLSSGMQRNRSGSCCTSMCSTSDRVHLPCQDIEQLEQLDPDPDAFFSFPSSPSAKILEEMGSGHIIEEMKSAKLLEGLGLGRHYGPEALEGRRSRAESPRGGHALSKGAFGSPFPVLGSSGRKTRPILDKKLKFFSLERASTAAVAKKFVNSDGAVASSTTDPYLETSSSNPLRRRDGHETDDYSSDLFEIEDMQRMSIKGFSGIELSCLPIKKSFACNEACEGSHEVISAPTCDPLALRNQVRGATAVRGANHRAKILREQATKMARMDQVRISPEETTTRGSSIQHNRGLTLMVLGLLRRKHLEVKMAEKGGPPPTKPSLPSASLSRQPLDLENKTPHSATVIPSSSSEPERSIKGLSIRQVLERHDRQQQGWQNDH